MNERQRAILLGILFIVVALLLLAQPYSEAGL